MTTIAARLLLLAVAALAFPAGTAAAQDIIVETALGEASVPLVPERVVVFDLASLDTLDALGVTVTGVPDAPFPDYLAAYGEIEKAGSLHEPDFEAVNALEPDLIIVGGRSSPHTQALSQIAPTIDMSVDEADFVVSATQRTVELGRIFERQAEAEALVRDLEAAVEALRGQASIVESGLIVMATGSRISAYGPGSRFGVLHTDYGVAPARKNLAAAIHGEAVSFEFIAETDPDWLFVVDRDAAIGDGAAAAALDNELVARTRAWTNDHVVYLDPANWYLVGGGLQAMRRNVEQLSQAFTADE